MRTINSGDNKNNNNKWKQNEPTKATFHVSIHGLKQVKRLEVESKKSMLQMPHNENEIKIS